MNIRALGLSVSGIAVAVSMALAAVNAASPPVDVKFALQFPPEVTINRMPVTTPSTTVQATVTLTNTGRTDVTLTSPNNCASHTWTVTEAGSSTVVDDRAICPMDYMPVTQTIVAGQSVSGTQDVVLTNSKYTNGGSYTLHYNYWGISQAANFTVRDVR